VFTTKYRKPALKGDVGLEVRGMIQQICRAHDI
jgi:REP element-mobilizing transposase RayT